jgi:flagellar basal-body rod protein FlgF
MIYGLYLSASGTMNTMHAQDTIANNLANAETAGFKRQMAMFQQRSTPRREQFSQFGNPMLDRIGGGQAVSPSQWDFSQGGIEDTGSATDVALVGEGFLAVRDAQNNLRLTRNGTMIVDREGFLSLSNTPGHRVLDAQRRPIRINPDIPRDQLNISKEGAIDHMGLPLAQLGVFQPPSTNQLNPVGDTLFAVRDANQLRPSTTTTVMQGYIERSNVDPAVELTRMIEVQRLLEANANFVRFQDQTISRAVTDLGRIS